MFKHKALDRTRNICGKKIYDLRKAVLPKMSQRQLAEQMQLHNIDMDKTAIKRIENGSRYITDIEVVAFCKIFSVSSSFFLEV